MDQGGRGHRVGQHLAVVVEPGEGRRVYVVPVEEAAGGLVDERADGGEQQENKGDKRPRPGTSCAGLAGCLISR